jgi:hypothetical protein
MSSISSIPTSWRAALGHPAAVGLAVCSVAAWAALVWLPPLKPFSDYASWLLVWGAAGYAAAVFVLRGSRSDPTIVASGSPEIRQLRAIRQAISHLLHDREALEVQTTELTRVLGEAVQTLDEQIEPTLRELVQREQELRRHLAQWESGALPPPDTNVLDRLRAIQARQRSAIDACIQQAANAQATLVALLQEGEDSSVATRAWEWADHLLTLYDTLAVVLRGQDDDTTALRPAAQSASDVEPTELQIVPHDVRAVAEEDLQRLTEEALRRLHNTEALTRSGLIELLPRTLTVARSRWAEPESTDPTRLAQGRALREVLEEAIDRMAPASGNGSLQYHILHEEYVLGWSNKRIITRHEIPDVTFYRQRREGVLVLARELREQEESLAGANSKNHVNGEASAG